MPFAEIASALIHSPARSFASHVLRSRPLQMGVQSRPPMTLPPIAARLSRLHPAQFARQRLIRKTTNLPWALAWILALAACKRDAPQDHAKVETRVTPVNVATSNEIDPPAPEPSAAPEPSVTASTIVPAKPPEPPKLPSWARNPPQPPGVPGLFARGLTGPIKEPFEGLLVCRIAVSGRWDAEIPFFGSVSQTYPDIRVRYGPHSVDLPRSSPSGTAVFAGVKLDASSIVGLSVIDVDPFFDDPIGYVALEAKDGFPMKAETKSLKVVCRGVPRSALDAQIKARDAALTRALVAMETSKVPIDLARPDACRPVIESAQQAVMQMASYVGFDDTNVRAAIARIGAVEASQAERFTALIDAELAKHPPDEFQTLPSARVRCHSTKKNRVEVEIGSRPLEHQFPRGGLGRVQFKFISTRGREEPPSVEHLYDGDQIIARSNVKFSPKEKVDIEFTLHFPKETPYALVAREGTKRVFLCRASER